MRIGLVVCGPIPLLSNAARHIYNGMQSHPLSKPLVDFQSALSAATEDLSSLFREADGHGANGKLHFFMLDQECDAAALAERRETFEDVYHCANHELNLIIVAVVVLVHSCS